MDISKSIIARSFELCQLIEDDLLITEVFCFIFELLPHTKPLKIKICNLNISKRIIAWSFKHCQLIEDN